MNTILAGIIGAVVSQGITIGVLGIKGVFSIDKRLSILERQAEPFTVNWHTDLEGRLTKLESRDLFAEMIKVLRTIKPGGNPIDPNRYQHLLNRMQTNALTQPEANELKDALVELKQEAENNKNSTTLLAILLALLVLAVLVDKK
jgi:hypothetical protein